MKTTTLETSALTSPRRRTRNMLRDVKDGVCVLTFDRPDASANLLDEGTLLELDAHLDWIERTHDLRGLILTSAKENIFIAGADVHALAGMADQPGPAPAKDSEAANPMSSQFGELIELGQRVFNRLAALPVMTVAAIHGACVGGGFELALACQYRLASDERVTKLGLPEVLLGILPAWGGCTRLPRLVGLPKALEMILAGKTLVAARALKLGLVDEVVPRARLMEAARERALHPPKPHRPNLRVSNNIVSAMLIRTRASRDLAARTRGNYPAPFEALDVVTHGISLPVEKSLELEREAILRLAQNSACHNLLRLFLLKERAKKPHPMPRANAIRPEARVDVLPRSGSATPLPVTRAAVVGAGVMGAGIAQWLSARGMSVALRDVNLEQLVRGMATIGALYDDAVKRHHLTVLEARDGRDRIFPAATDAPLREAEIVIEAATEKLALKQDIFRCLAAQTKPDTILATNTSALSISDIADDTHAASRIVGLHFFNPVHRMELVEVVAGAATSPDVLARTVEFTRRIGKVPVVVRDSPGFVVNRVLMPYLVEAVRLFDAGVPAHDIDEAMLDFGMPMGPLRLLDEVGLDVAMHVVATLAGHFGERVAAPRLIARMMEAGMLGRKTGRGFYDHAQDKPNHDLDAMRGVHRHTRHSRDDLARRMALLMVNEAARCEEEGVTGTPGDIDLAMVLGTGFAPFRGGPLRYADAMGAPAVVATLEQLARLDNRFEPCARLKSMAADKALFYPPPQIH